jgi:hypothetical protein
MKEKFGLEKSPQRKGAGERTLTMGAFNNRTSVRFSYFVLACMCAGVSLFLLESQLPDHFCSRAYGQEAENSAKSASPVRGVSGKPISLPVALPEDRISEFSLLKITGLPNKLSLSSGFLFGDAWAVALKEANELAIVSPDGFEGQFVLDIQLIKRAGGQPERQSINVTIRAAAVFSPQEEAAAFKYGQELLRTGDISAARTIFERLAKRGSAVNAYAAGLTYDPQFLSTIKVVGLNGDLKKAKSWYQRAAELGNQDAAQRLKTLSPP